MHLAGILNIIDEMDDGACDVKNCDDASRRREYP